MITMIAAMDKNRLIGNNGQLPWHLPADLQYFKERTKGFAVVMGSKTYWSLPESVRPLPGRENIVITSQGKTFKNELIWRASSSLVAIAAAASLTKKIMVIGGASVYEQFLPKADRLLITRIDHEFEGDTYFPEFEKDFRCVFSQKGPKNKENPYDYYFEIYERIEEEETI